MVYGIVLEKISESGFEGFYYAHIPALDLTTQGFGMDGARAAAEDLAIGWIQVKRQHGEAVPPGDASIFSTIEITEDALQVA